MVGLIVSISLIVKAVVVNTAEILSRYNTGVNTNLEIVSTSTSKFF